MNKAVSHLTLNFLLLVYISAMPCFPKKIHLAYKFQKLTDVRDRILIKIFVLMHFIRQEEEMQIKVYPILFKKWDIVITLNNARS